MAGEIVTCMSIGERCVSAVAVESAKASARVRAAMLETIPTDLDPSDARAFGAWLRDRLRAAGIDAKRLVLGLERREVVTKRLVIEAAADAAELPDAVRLGMSRQLTFSIAQAIVDYAEIDRTDGLLLLAAAVPGSRIELLRETVAAAGATVDAIGLTASGIARLAQIDDDAPALLVARVPDGIELVVVERGRMGYARWAGVPGGAAAGEVATEVRRTAASYRAAAGGAEIGTVVLLGPWPAEVGEACRVPGGLATVTVDPVAQLAGEIEEPALLPLAGLAVERAAAGRRSRLAIDLAHPKRAPDRAATRRQTVLAAAFALILVLGLGSVLGRQALSRADREIEALREVVDEQREMRRELVRGAARLEHQARWAGAGGRPLEELLTVARHLSDRERVVVDEWILDVEPVVTYEKRGRGSRPYDERGWRSGAAVTARLTLLVADRSVIEDLRARLVEDPRYVVSTPGVDGAETNVPAYPLRVDLRLQAVREDGDPAAEAAP